MRAILSAFIAGEILFLFLTEMPQAYLMTLAWILVFMLLLILIFHIKKYQKNKNFNWAYTFACGCSIAFLLGFLWLEYLSQARLQHVLPKDLEGIPLVIEGIVDGLPQDGIDGRRFTIKVLQWQKASLWHQTNSFQDSQKRLFPPRISLGWYAPRDFFGASAQALDLQKIPKIFPGQRWLLTVKLKQARGTLNPHAFDYERWMFMNNLGANGYVFNPNGLSSKAFKPQKLSENSYNLLANIERLRFLLREKILNAFPKEAAYRGVLAALVMGDQNSIAQDDWIIFNVTGIGHLISISGLHVTMLAGFGAWIANRLWRRGRLPLLVPAQKIGALVGFITAFLYTLLAGFQIPAQRTMMMVGVVGVALWLGRIPKAFDIWWWALALVLFLNPWAIYTPGFWLSFGAVAFILYAMPAQENLQESKAPDVEWIMFERFRESITQACRVQAVVTIALIPMTLWWFSQFSLVSPLANAFAIPLISFVITPLAMIGAFLPSFIGDYCLHFAHYCIEGLVWLLRPMSTWSWSVIYAAKPSWWAFILGTLGALLAIKPGDMRLTWRSRLAGLLLCLALLLPKLSRLGEGLDSGDFKVLVWDIGQGTAVLIQTKNHHLLYDTGPVGGPHNDPGLRTILPYLRGEGISKLDMLAISHRDADHIGGVKSIAQNIVIDRVIGSIPENHALMNTLVEQNLHPQPCQAGQEWEWDGVRFIVWHPAPQTTFEAEFHQGKPNELSCVIEVRNRYHSVWLTGDVEKNGESEIVQRIHDSSHDAVQWNRLNKVLMAPHHGSKTSSTPQLIHAVDPQFAFSQSGYQNRYGHPHPIVVKRYKDRGTPLWDSSHTGAQIWLFQGTDLSFQIFRETERRLWHR